MCACLKGQFFFLMLKVLEWFKQSNTRVIKALSDHLVPKKDKGGPKSEQLRQLFMTSQMTSIINSLSLSLPLAFSGILLETTPDRGAQRVRKACLHMYLAYRYIDDTVLEISESKHQAHHTTFLQCASSVSLLPSSFWEAPSSACCSAIQPLLCPAAAHE